MALPAQIELNAFTGDDEAVTGGLAPGANAWGSVGEMLERQAPLAPGDPVNLADWRHEKVGWGVLLADNDDLSEEDRAKGTDAPEPIRQLLADRPDAPILRYRPDLGFVRVARYVSGKGRLGDARIGMSLFGVAEGHLPLYVLIVGSPQEIPWGLQYSLNRRHHVGRLDLDDDGLANYVTALRTDWAGMESDPAAPLVWGVDHDSMTAKMAATIAGPISGELAGDGEIAVESLAGAHATCDALVAALAARKPSVVITSSHGKTGPLDDVAAMRATLGLPVGADRATLDLETLIAAWQPAGAIWFAHACCSAGSADGTSYEGLLEPGSQPDLVTRAVGQLGAAVAPLPTRLLGASQPLRAFVGHVEPTFSWTLIDRETGQFLTFPLVSAVYPALYRRCPLGITLDGFYRGVGDLYKELADARKEVNQLVAGARDRATYARLTAIDRESLVVLGDPTVALPPLPSQVGKPMPPSDCGTDPSVNAGG